VEINFKTTKLEGIFNSEKELLKNFGTENGRLIMRRMTVLSAAPTLADVPARRPERMHALKGNRKGQFAVDIKHPFRLLFLPNHDPIPTKEDGGVDLSKITAITILRVEDYH
jgi:proteic killer suppression protein